jgi:large subunit ribosomal protein L22
MEVRAIAKFVRVQPRKVRIIADQVRGKSAVQTSALLRFHPSKGAKALRKVVVSAMANAQENHGIGPDQLTVAQIMVDEGPRMKRIQARSMGRANRITKKTSHITVIVQDVEPTATVKPHGTKSKPRPTFAAPSKGRKKGTAASKSEENAVTPAPEEIEETSAAESATEVEAVEETQEPVATSEASTDAVSEETQAEASEPDAETADDKKEAN